MYGSLLYIHLLILLYFLIRLLYFSLYPIFCHRWNRRASLAYAFTQWYLAYTKLYTSLVDFLKHTYTKQLMSFLEAQTIISSIFHPLTNTINMDVLKRMKIRPSHQRNSVTSYDRVVHIVCKIIKHIFTQIKLH